MRRGAEDVVVAAADLQARPHRGGLAAADGTRRHQRPGLGGLVESGAVRLVQLDEVALRWTISFLERYASAEAQRADAALMYIAEREGINTVFTLDRRDFSVYRTTDGRALHIVPES